MKYFNNIVAAAQTVTPNACQYQVQHYYKLKSAKLSCANKRGCNQKECQTIIARPMKL